MTQAQHVCTMSLSLSLSLVIVLVSATACVPVSEPTASNKPGPSPPRPQAVETPPQKPTQAQPIEKRWANSFTFKTHSISENHEGFCPYELSAEYPEAISTKSSVKRFNRWIKRKILADVKRFRWLELRAEPLAKREGKKSLTEGLELTYEIYFSNQRLISLRLTHRVMAAGQMHPVNYYETINYDLLRYRPLTARDVFRRGYLKVFSTYSRKYLTETYQISVDDWFKDGSAARVGNFENWNLVPDGVLISFEDYQIASHSFGQAELIIPFSALTSVLRPRSPSTGFVQTAEISLPQRMKLALDRRFPGWKYAEVNEEIRKFLKDEVSPFARPDIISGDFNGDDKADYAVLIDQTSSGRKLVVFLERRTGSRMHVLDPEGEYLTLLSRGERDYDYEKQSHFTYQNDAICTGIFEKGGSSYIYRNGKFRTMITSD